MPNVIVDAGTDAKIAKFLKRGIELIDLALLEPVEVWGEGGRERDARRESVRIVADETGASMVVNASGGRVIPSSKGTLLRPAESGLITPSATSSATSLHSHMALSDGNASYSTVQTPIPQHLSSQMATDRHHYSTPPSSNVAPATVNPPPISYSNSSSSNNPTPMPPSSPVSMASIPLTIMPSPTSPAPGSASSKRNLFNKLFNRKQIGSNLLSPPGLVSPGSPGQPYSQQHSLAQSQMPPIITTTGCDQPELEVSPSPTFVSFALSHGPVTNTVVDDVIATGMDRSFSSRSDSMQKRSAPPPALIERDLSGSDLTPPTEQQTTPTQKSIASWAKMKIPMVSAPIPGTVEIARGEREKGYGKYTSLASITSPLKSTLKNRLSSAVLMGGGGGGPQSNSQANGSGLNVDDFPLPSKKKGRDRDRDASPQPSLGSLVGNMSSNGSADSHGGNGGGAVGFGGSGNGHTSQQVATTQAQTQSEIMMNLRQQQLQLRPPILGIQPTFVSSLEIPSTEIPDPIFGQRALMYVWLVRRWMKKSHSRLSGLGDSAAGFLGGVVDGLKVDKDKERGKRKEKHKNKSSSGDFRDGLGAVTAPLMYGGVEVRFEWKRAKAGKEKSRSGKKKSRTMRGRTGTMDDERAESDGEVETSRTRERGRDDGNERGSMRGSDGGGLTKTKERLKSEEKKKYRMSTGSLSSTSEMDGSGLKKMSSTIGNNQYDDEDSDPEDSDTPWICTLKLRKGAGHGAGGSSLNLTVDAQTQTPILQTQVLRIKVGTLSPTPHHPKVVAMLKVPFPLPDVEVERMGVVKRRGINIGGGVPPQIPNEAQDTPYDGLMLTAEEIKDVVCSTGLWLVVREGFGGVGRVSRKGDGWRIRP